MKRASDAAVAIVFGLLVLDLLGLLALPFVLWWLA